MEFDENVETMEQSVPDSVLEIECPECGATLVTEPDASDLYCDECMRIVMQDPITGTG